MGMLRFIAIMCMLGAGQFISAQCPSLIPNGGFETYSALPNDDCGWSLATGWTNAATSSDCSTSNGTPDYFHLQGTGPYAALPINYFSNVLPFEGDAVMGVGGNVSLVENAREYISIPLTTPMVVGNEYTLTFSMTIGSPLVGGIYANGWGFLLSNGPVFQPAGTLGLINAPGYEVMIPAVFTSETWQTFTFTITADQPYTQFTFGNFLTDAQQSTSLYGTQDIISLAYVFVDDFVLQDNNQSDVTADLGPDLTLCTNNITLDGIDPNANGYSWNTGATSSAIVVNTPGLYVLEVSGQCGVAVDSILILDCPPLNVDLGLDITVCPGEGFTLEAIVTGGLAPYNYVWNPINFSNSPLVNSSTLVDAFYSVVVTDANGTLDEDTVWVQVYPSVGSVDLGVDLVICPGESVELDATLTGAVSYSWSNGLQIPNIVVTEPGTYFVQVNSTCETDIDSVVVFSGGIEVPDFVSEYVVCDLEELLIGPSLDSNVNFTWLDDPTQAFPRRVFETGTYPFEVTDNCGVRVFEVVVNEVNCDCMVFVPNSFTPNGDNINDAIAPVCECGFTQYDFKVYNRWGDLIFQSNNPNQFWVGSSDESSKVFAPDGVYNWSLNGVSKSINEDLILHDLKGSINLVR